MYKQQNIHDVAMRFSKIDLSEKNIRTTRQNDGEYKTVLPQKYQNDFSSFYHYNGFKGQLRYGDNTSVKSDPITLDKWGNEYEEGRRTLLNETANNYGVKSAGFILPNSAVKKYGNNKTPALNVVGVNL